MRTGLQSIGRPFWLALLIAALASACSSPHAAPIRLQRNLLTVDNQTAQDWLDVEIWINRQYRNTVPKIAARSRFSTTLDVFVAGFGQRFDRRRERIDDLRLKARTADGAPVELRLETTKR